MSNWPHLGMSNSGPAIHHESMMNGCKNEFPRPLKFHLEGTSRVEEFQFGTLEEDKVSVEVQNIGRMKNGCLCRVDKVDTRNEQRYCS